MSAPNSLPESTHVTPHDRSGRRAALATAHNGPQVRRHQLSKLAGALNLALHHKLKDKFGPLPEPKETYGVRAHRNGCASELQTSAKHQRVGGGLRGRVTGQSRQARGRLIQRLGQIDQKRYPAKQVLFVTLTYHEHWPADPEGWQAHIKAWRKRVERKHGPLAAVWVKEFQKRGAPHFHLVVFCDHAPMQDPTHELLNTMWLAWYEIAGAGSHWHLRYGFRAEVPRRWRGVMSYASKYISSKDDQHQYVSVDGEMLPTGRMWGVWRSEAITGDLVVTTMTYREYLTMRRIVRRATTRPENRHRSRRHRHKLTNQRFLMGFGELNRLLAYLGIIGSDACDEENEHRGLPTQRRR